MSSAVAATISEIMRVVRLALGPGQPSELHNGWLLPLRLLQGRLDAGAGSGWAKSPTAPEP